MNIVKLSDHSVDLSLLDDNSIVFDLGGYKGDFTKELTKYIDCKVYIYEPNYRLRYMDNIFKDNKNIVINYKGISNVVCNKYLYLGMKFGPNWVKQTGSSYYSSHKDVRERKIKTECTTIDNEIKKYGIKNIDLMKINVEGEEKVIIPSLPLNKINQLTVSFHEHCDIEGYNKSTVNELRDFIKDNGFEEVVYNNYDTLFIRKEFIK